MNRTLPNKICGLIVASVCCIAAFPTPPPFPPEDPASPTDEPIHGKDLYLKECAICHGREGDGTERGTLLKKPSKVYATHITRFGRKGNPQYAIPMPAYQTSSLSDRQLVEIWSYLDSFPAPTTGEEIYRTYCENCHGRDARGGMSGHPLVNGQGLVAVPWVFELWVRWGQEEGPYDNRGSYMPSWNKAEISDAAIVSLSRYLESLSSESERAYVP